MELYLTVVSLILLFLYICILLLLLHFMYKIFKNIYNVMYVLKAKWSTAVNNNRNSSYESQYIF